MWIAKEVLIPVVQELAKCESDFQALAQDALRRFADKMTSDQKGLVASAEPDKQYDRFSLLCQVQEYKGQACVQRWSGLLRYLQVGLLSPRFSYPLHSTPFPSSPPPPTDPHFLKVQNSVLSGR